ncbi:MAG: M15 family metallopeptidase [Bacteroidales bacterium]|nr:M15 family metallopeptidase [Bacteroidales bacterium]MCM1147450.1 M15 family metallopeptidase [Bacteroidales bacterium]MCM1206119.1 M15 family metallopeptidase [Bacillota bacterium]MCM1510050.1 M15 family metallopeptidase [Clostridium sp.]
MCMLFGFLISIAAGAQNGFTISNIESSETLASLSILHFDENGKTCKGTIICNKQIARDLIEIFKALYKAHYPIHSVRPVSEYGNDDERSMAANNTSCYNPRRTKNGGLSKHAKGMAIDVNPLWNPCIHISDKNAGLIEPKNAVRTRESKPKEPRIDKNDLCYRLFTKYGFRWGGSWKSLKDYQHFEK